MVRVHVLAEGQTEETFIHRVLRPHFWPLGLCFYPYFPGKGTGGICEYPQARQDILTALKQDTTGYCTTMLDYYAMPDSWPGRKTARQKPFAERSSTTEEAILADLSAELGPPSNRARLIPYVQMHEFEALLFSHPTTLADGLELPDAMAIQQIRDQFGSPEEIDDSQRTAPSKRILGLNGRYRKPMHGVLIAQRIGLAAMRVECPHFNAWIEKLETLAGG